MIAEGAIRALLAREECLSAQRPEIRQRLAVFENVHELELDNLANRLSFVQKIEALVDLLKLHAAAHQPIDWQLAALIELDVARNIACRYARADIASLHRALFPHKVHD